MHVYTYTYLPKRLQYSSRLNLLLSQCDGVHCICVHTCTQLTGCMQCNTSLQNGAQCLANHLQHLNFRFDASIESDTGGSAGM